MTDLRARAAAAANPDVQNATEEALRSPSADTIGAAVEAAVAARHGVPDLTESGIADDQDVKAHVAWSRVMGEIHYIAKGTSPGLRYEFRGIDAVLQAVGPALRKHGVSVVQTGVEPAYEKVPTGGGKTMNYCRVTVTYAVIGPQGDMLPVPLVSVGEAFDSGDKATPKAVSVALRSLYLNCLAIPTGDPRMDPEHGPQYEIATPKPPTAEEYREEIGRESTSVARLRTIREELNRNPGMANTVVQDVDGAEMTLLKFLVKVGTERAAKGGQQ